MAVRRLRVEWDSHAFPVWWVSDGACAVELPVSPDLRAELQAWSDEATTANWDEIHGRKAKALSADWLALGRSLADRLQDELGDGFDVVFGPSERSEGT